MNTSWWVTVPQNPFRLFFPLGILFGVLGVGHWALWSVGVKIPNIALVHAALQTQGFLVSFVVGFLMTAFPRFTGTWPANKTEITVMSAASLSFLVAILRHNWLAGQIFFLALILGLIIFAARRVPHRNKDLPPSFLLMGFGFLHALLGSSFMLASRFGVSNFAIFSIGRQMVQVGFLLCMVLGVTGKLAPFLLGYTDDPQRDTQQRPGFGSGATALVLHGLTGAGLLASFFVDNLNPKVGAALRAVLVTVHMLAFARIGRPLKKKTTLMFFFHVSTWMVPLGLWVGLFWPSFRIAALHIVFIGGFSLMIFSFGMLIVLSHSAKAALINSRLIPMRAIGGLVLSALVLRFLAEVVPSEYMFMIHLSSGLWIIAALVWGAYTTPKILSGFHAEH
jgi:uncharacterized protein involved in response to NO